MKYTNAQIPTLAKSIAKNLKESFEGTPTYEQLNERTRAAGKYLLKLNEKQTEMLVREIQCIIPFQLELGKSVL